MPLSKEMNAKRMRKVRLHAKVAKLLVQPDVQPTTDALQSKSSPLKPLSNTVAPPELDIELPNERHWKPNLDASGEVIPEYY